MASGEAIYRCWCNRYCAGGLEWLPDGAAAWVIRGRAGHTMEYPRRLGRGNHGSAVLICSEQVDVRHCAYSVGVLKIPDRISYRSSPSASTVFMCLDEKAYKGCADHISYTPMHGEFLLEGRANLTIPARSATAVAGGGCAEPVSCGGDCSDNRFCE